MVRLKELELHVLVRVAEFQFHMVRLKGRAQRDTRRVWTFQFHMVRLKASVVIYENMAEYYFNSTWYD